MARRKDSSETVIAIMILTANLIREQKAARLLFFLGGASMLMNIMPDRCIAVSGSANPK